MKFTLLPLIILTLFTPAANSQDILVTPAWLNTHKDDPDLVILQVNRMQLDFEDEHLDGARFLWPGWLAPNTPEGNMNAIDIKNGEKVLRSLGINNQSKVIVTFVKDEVTVTARMFLMLEYLGLKGQVLWLDGGLEDWKANGFPVAKGNVTEYKKGKFKARPLPIIVDKDYVKQRLEVTNSVIVDARFKRYYDGEPVGYPRNGHIKGAKNIPYNEMVNESYHFKSKEDLASYFTPIAPDKNNEIVMYCFIGQTASVVYLAGRVLGYPMKLYDGSMEEWSRISELPVETTVVNQEN
ncbi:MAG TPA: hypothetical protein DIS90_15665 [Cytophagales bacterium]|nr:hypothetical protein [Cytophagales bacterium]